MSRDVRRIVRSDCEEEPPFKTKPSAKPAILTTVLCGSAERGLTEQDGLGLLDGLSEPSHGQVVQPPVELFGRVQEVHQERGLERATAGLMAGEDASHQDE